MNLNLILMMYIHYLMTSIRTLLADPDRLDRNTLFAVLADEDEQVSDMLACLAPPGSLLQIVAALQSGWSWSCDGWERHTDELVGIITNPRCPFPEQMIKTWVRIPSAVGILRDRTDTLIALAQKRIDPEWHAYLAILFGPSDKSARLLVRSHLSNPIGRIIRRWSMVIDPDDPTAWQTRIGPKMLKSLRQIASSWAFPAWGWDDEVEPKIVLSETVNDIIDGWSPDHPSIRRRIGWLEHHVSSYLRIERLAFVASIGRSDALAEAVCAHIGHKPSFIFEIASAVPWRRLHPRIQIVIDETMQQSSNDPWKRTWACAIGDAPVVPDNDIHAFLLMWRIDPKRWDDIDPSIRAALVSSILLLPDHRYGWGAHPDLVAEERREPAGGEFRFWNPDVPPSDLLAWIYADHLRRKSTLQEARSLIDLLMTLPPDRRTRFEQIIDWRLGGRSKPTAQSPWDWTVWGALPAAERQRHLRDRLRVLWGNRTTTSVYRVWMARSHILDTVAVAFRALLDGRRAPRILAALFAQIPALRANMTDDGPSLPFPDDLDAALRTQIERLPLTPDAQAYAAWGIWLLARAGDVGADLIALYPDVAAALAPILPADQQKVVAASPAAQGWDSMRVMHRAVACAPAQELPPPPIQRRIS